MPLINWEHFLEEGGRSLSGMDSPLPVCVVKGTKSGCYFCGDGFERLLVFQH